MSPLPWPAASPAAGSLDGAGAGDHDQPYRFGFRPSASAPYPFSTRQYARLLVLRGRVRDSPASARGPEKAHDLAVRERLVA
jgi:hypothetical protein